MHLCDWRLHHSCPPTHGRTCGVQTESVPMARFMDRLFARARGCSSLYASAIWYATHDRGEQKEMHVHEPRTVRKL